MHLTPQRGVILRIVCYVEKKEKKRRPRFAFCGSIVRGLAGFLRGTVLLLFFTSNENLYTEIASSCFAGGLVFSTLVIAP